MFYYKSDFMIRKINCLVKKTAFVVVYICITVGLSAQSNKNAWRSLLNGKDLTGWKMVGSKGVAVIIDSAITCNQVANTTEHTFVTTKEKFSDFILEMDVRCDSTYNTGILIRSVDKPENCDTCQVSLVRIPDKNRSSGPNVAGQEVFSMIMVKHGIGFIVWKKMIGQDLHLRLVSGTISELKQ